MAVRLAVAGLETAAVVVAAGMVVLARPLTDRAEGIAVAQQAVVEERSFAAEAVDTAVAVGPHTVELAQERLAVAFPHCPGQAERTDPLVAEAQELGSAAKQPPDWPIRSVAQIGRLQLSAYRIPLGRCLCNSGSWILAT